MFLDDLIQIFNLLGGTTARVNGVLSVARAMGDFQLHPFITCEPDVFRLDISELNENFIVAGCDGLWDVVDDAMVYIWKEHY